MRAPVPADSLKGVTENNRGPKNLLSPPCCDYRFPTGDTENSGASGVKFEDGCFVATTIDAVQPGSQVTISYGPKSNTELLAFYGFCVAENPYDSAEVRFLMHTCLAVSRKRGPGKSSCVLKGRGSETAGAAARCRHLVRGHTRFTVTHRAPISTAPMKRAISP